MAILELKNTTSNRNSVEGLGQHGGDGRKKSVNNRNYPIWTTERKEDENHNQQNLRNMWNSNKGSNTCVIGVLEGEGRKDRAEKVLKEMPEKSPRGWGDPRKSSLWRTGLFAKLCFKLLPFYQRPTLVPVFTNKEIWRKFSSYEKKNCLFALYHFGLQKLSWACPTLG